MNKTEQSACRAYCYEWPSKASCSLCTELRDTCPAWQKLINNEYETKERFMDECDALSADGAEDILTQAMHRQLMGTLIGQVSKYTLGEMSRLVKDLFREDVNDY